MDTLIIIGTAIVLSLLVFIPYIRMLRKKEIKTQEADLMALKYGLKEPATIHPVVDPMACICTGNCVEVCPEEIVLGIQDGRAVAIAPARCIGHGLCERACPMDAIELVFGTETRGVDIPRVKGNFETNVDGIYIVGELGGMGLIWNAFEQGRQCIEGIMKENRPAPEGAYDALIIGCGPAGLSASLHARHHNLHVITIEKESEFGGTVRTYPRKKLVLTNPIKVP
ncbi:MAG: FAD-binding protein, partial [Rhodothermaceae bacterium]|nr:FAD-binding protein [Rhodothermaceae bacterium]